MKRIFMFLVAGVFVIYANATGVGNGVHVNLDDSLYSGDGPNDTTYTGSVHAKCEREQVAKVAKGSGLKYCETHARVYVQIKPSNAEELVAELGDTAADSYRLEKTIYDSEAGHCSEDSSIIYDDSYEGSSNTFTVQARTDCKQVPE